MANGDADEAGHGVGDEQSDPNDDTGLSLQFDEEWSPPPASRAARHHDTEEPLAVDPPYEHRPVPEYMGNPSFVADAFTFPFRGRGISAIVLGGLFALGIRVLAFLPLAGIVAAVIGFAFFAAFYFDIVSDTVGGRDDVPDWPAADDGLAIQAIRMLFLFALSIGPAVVVSLVIDQAIAPAPWHLPALLTTLGWGAIYWPMSVLAAQVHGTVFSALPHVVLPAILRCLPHYLVAAAVFAGILLSMEAYEEWAGAVPFLGFVLAAPVWVYALMVKARLIGLTYRAHRDAIGWPDGLD